MRPASTHGSAEPVKTIASCSGKEKVSSSGVDTFDAGLVVADGGGCEENLFAGVFQLVATEVFLGCGAVISGVCGLTVGYQNQELYRFWTP